MRAEVQQIVLKHANVHTPWHVATGFVLIGRVLHCTSRGRFCALCGYWLPLLQGLWLAEHTAWLLH